MRVKAIEYPMNHKVNSCSKSFFVLFCFLIYFFTSSQKTSSFHLSIPFPLLQKASAMSCFWSDLFCFLFGCQQNYGRTWPDSHETQLKRVAWIMGPGLRDQRCPSKWQWMKRGKGISNNKTHQRNVILWLSLHSKAQINMPAHEPCSKILCELRQSAHQTTDLQLFIDPWHRQSRGGCYKPTTQRLRTRNVPNSSKWLREEENGSTCRASADMATHFSWVTSDDWDVTLMFQLHTTIFWHNSTSGNKSRHTVVKFADLHVIEQWFSKWGPGTPRGQWGGSR